VKIKILLMCVACCFLTQSLLTAEDRRTTNKKPKTRAELLREAMKDPKYKERIKRSIEDLKAMQQAAEANFAEGNYREAAAFYKSITGAYVPGMDKGVAPVIEQARERLIEMEGKAQQELRDAEDADLKRDYIKAVGHLQTVLRDYPFTKASKTAMSRLSALRSRKDVAAYVEFAEAEAAEAAGDLVTALRGYQRIADNPRYEGTVPVFKAKRRIKALKSDEATRDAVKQQLQTVADKEAPPILNTARNFLMNHKPAQAKEKFRTVVEKYPGTSYAEEAQKEIDKLE
jgi:hypothetical protein